MPDWTSEIDKLFQEEEAAEKIRKEKLAQLESEADSFISNTVMPAFEELKRELGRHQRQVQVDRHYCWARIIVSYAGKTELHYYISGMTLGEIHPKITFFYPLHYPPWTKESSEFFWEHGQDRTVKDITKDEVVQRFLGTYKVRLGDV